MRVLVTGAGGLIGRALTRHFAPACEVFPLMHRDLDITSRDAVDRFVDRLRPDLIVNCAVVGVDECERDPALAAAINVEGPRLLARAADECGAAMLHFSSNYVFDGRRSDRGFYTPEERAVPINEYGRTKLEGERVVREECERSWIVRTSWVFGIGKESFLATVHQRLRNREGIRATDDVFASATYVHDLTERIGALVTSDDYGLFHINNEGVCSHAEFADAAGALVGLGESERAELIDKVSEEMMRRDAPRPRWTPIQCSPIAALPPMRGWREALAAYIREDDAG